MSDGSVQLDREVLLAELQQVFDTRTAEVLLGVLDKVVEQAQRTAGVGEDWDGVRRALTELTEAQRRTEERVQELAEAQQRTEERVQELAEAQQRTEERVQELAEAQRRTEERVQELAEAQQRTEEQVRELAEAQRRTEERVSGLEAALERLAEAQRRTDERVSSLEVTLARLAEAQAQTEQQVKELAAAQTRTEQALERLSQQVGGLSETVGGDIEDIAYIVLHDVLQREFGWQVGILERTWQNWDNEPEEVNIFGQASDPARPGEVIWIVGEAKHNLSLREVQRFIRQVGRARQHLKGEVFPVCFCYRARPEVQQQIRDAGIRLVFSYGKLV
jgi:chemotaxis protein histidine kinase CheA